MNYTGATDLRSGPRPGTVRFVEYLRFLHGGDCLGIYANRTIRGSTKRSVHQTGRAFDYRPPSREIRYDVLELLDFHFRPALEAIHDYENTYVPGPGFGAAWRCDRNTWKVYNSPTIKPAGAIQPWIHAELVPAYADDPQLVDELFRKVFK